MLSLPALSLENRKMTLDQKALEAAIRADQWPANLHAIVDAVNAASDDNDLSTEQCVALGIILASRSSAIVEEPMAVAWRWRWGKLGSNQPWKLSTEKPGPFPEEGYEVEPLFPSPQPHTGRAGVTEALEALEAWQAATLADEAPPN